MQKYYIYKIINLIDNKTYIGQRHCPKNKTPENDPYMGSGVYIRRAEKKYGMENFKKEILARNVETKEMIDELEISYIKYERMKAHYGIIPGCYNIANGGNGPGTVSDETRAKMSASAKNRPHLSMSDETRAKMSASAKNRPHLSISDETRAKLSASHKGHHHSAETKAKMSAAQKGNNLGLLWWNNGEKEIKAKECPEGYKRGRITSHKGEHNPMYGKKQTEETKQKQRTASLGKTHKGATYTEQMIQDMSNLKKQQAIVKRVREKNGTTSE